MNHKTQPAPPVISDRAKQIATHEKSGNDSVPGYHVQKLMDEHAAEIAALQKAHPPRHGGGR